VHVNQSGELRQFGDVISRRLGCRYADSDTREYLYLVCIEIHSSYCYLAACVVVKYITDDNWRAVRESKCMSTCRCHLLSHAWWGLY